MPWAVLEVGCIGAGFVVGWIGAGLVVGWIGGWGVGVSVFEGSGCGCGDGVWVFGDSGCGDGVGVGAGAGVTGGCVVSSSEELGGVGAGCGVVCGAGGSTVSCCDALSESPFCIRACSISAGLRAALTIGGYKLLAPPRPI